MKVCWNTLQDSGPPRPELNSLVINKLTIKRNGRDNE